MNEQNYTPRLSPEALTQLNAQTLTVMSKPYEPIVYAIPEEQWNAMLTALTQSIQYQPQMTEKILTLASRNDMTTFTKQTAYQVKTMTDETVDRIRRMVSEQTQNAERSVRNQTAETEKFIEQVGRKQEQLCGKTELAISNFSDRTKLIWKIIIGVVAGNAFLSAVASALVYFLFLR